MYKPRMSIDEAISDLVAHAKECHRCGTPYVYGRDGNVYCSVACAKADASKAYRARHNIPAQGGKGK